MIKKYLKKDIYMYISPEERFTKASKNFQENDWNSYNQNDKEIPKQRYIYQKKDRKLFIIQDQL